MRAFPAAVAVTLAALISTSAPAQVYVTSITAAFPDPNGQVPAFNAVPGATSAVPHNSICVRACCDAVSVMPISRG